MPGEPGADPGAALVGVGVPQVASGSGAGFAVRGEVIERTGVDTFHIEQGSFTTCRCPPESERAPWEIDVTIDGADCGWLGLGPVAGAILPPVNAAAEGDRMLVIGVRRPGTADARVAGLRLRYESGGVVFESVLNWYLVLREPGTE